MRQKVLLLTRRLLNRGGTRVTDTILLAWLTHFARLLTQFDLQLEVWQEGGGWTKELANRFTVKAVPDRSPDLTLAGVNQAMWEHAAAAAFAVYTDPLLAYPQAAPVSIILGHSIPTPDSCLDRSTGRQRQQWMAKIRQGLSTVDYVIVNHTAYIQWVMATFPGLNHKIKHIADCFQQLPPAATLHDAPALPAAARLLFACPALPQCGISETIRAVDYLMERIADLTFIFHGAVPEPLDKQFAGWFAERPRCWLKKGPANFQFGDIALFPVKRGPVPVALIQQALTGGTAVVGSMLGALPDLIVHGYNGLLIKPLTGDICDAVVRLSEDHRWREKICRRALETGKALQPAAWEKRWRAIIEELVRKKDFLCPNC